jgi:tRNA-uridine 2-sulfurtransferase
MTIAVAVSGGRDSLLVLALLKQQRFQPVAIHAFLAQKTQPDVLQELGENCRRLDIPLQVVDLRDQFQKLVIGPFIRSYMEGRTPNPCMWCNVRIKFGLLLDIAQRQGVATLATGHYARLVVGAEGPELWRGLDAAKDQSYFLAMLDLEQLKHAAFPLENQHKQDVLQALDGFGLSPPLPGESQEICFISGDYRDFLARNLGQPPSPGPIVLADGRLVGEHKGLWRYTVGQRKGLDIAWSEPLYVLAKEPQDNRLVVAPRRDLNGGRCLLQQVNMLVSMQGWPDDLFVQTRYRQEPVPLGTAATVRANWPYLELPASSEPPAPGQVAVLYSGRGQVLAGAVIAEGSKTT